jgi:hypothetical protein
MHACSFNHFIVIFIQIFAEFIRLKLENNVIKFNIFRLFD